MKPNRQQHETYWLWLGAAALTIATIAAGTAAIVVTQPKHFDFWGSPEMIVAYVAVLTAIVCFVSAIRGVRMPFVRDELPPLDKSSPPEPEVPEKHRVELQQFAEDLERPLRLERPASHRAQSFVGRRPLRFSWISRTSTQTSPLIAQSFRAHFPELAGKLDKWDVLIADLDAARDAMRDWVAAEVEARGMAGYYGDMTMIVTNAAERDRPDPSKWSEEEGWLFLDGSPIVVFSVGDDVSALKKPVDDLLAAAPESTEGIALRELRARVDEAKREISEQLERIRARHVIRGRCDLCA
jgi:hypothetical protein